MTDKEKLAYLIGYIKGVMGECTYIASLYVKEMNKVIEEISK